MMTRRQKAKRYRQSCEHHEQHDCDDDDDDDVYPVSCQVS